MSQPNRLPSGGRIDRGAPLTFTFDGQVLEGYAGDTVASALLANGISLIARSIKLHRPRGIVAAGAEDPNSLVQIGRGAQTVPDLRATQAELYDGMEVRSVNHWPSLKFDVTAVTGLFAPLMPAGFYYKTFKWPPSWWQRVYEPQIRHAAGFGTAPDAPDPDRYDKVNRHCDLLVVGGGPAGLAAALEAGRRGARVMLCDEQSEFGGRLLATREEIDGQPATEWVAAAVEELAALPEVTLLPRTTAFGFYDHGFSSLLERVTDHLGPVSPDRRPRQRQWRVRARRTVLAAGAIERPLVFCNNDRPGIMTASAVSTYVNRHSVTPGQRAVVFTNNDSAYQTALDLSDRGVAVAAVIDVRPEPAGTLVERVRAEGIEILSGHAVVDTVGRRHLKNIKVMRLNARGDGIYGDVRTIACDLLASSGGWNPVIHLHAQPRGETRYDVSIAAFVAEGLRADVQIAGAANGGFALGQCIREGLASGARAAAGAGFGSDDIEGAAPSVTEPDEAPIRPMWRVPARRPVSRAPKQFVDFQNDQTAADIYLAIRENYRSIEHIKRYTSMGFGTDQGKLNNINGTGIAAEALGEEIGRIGTTSFRPAYTPVTFGALAGREIGAERFHAVRKTPMHRWHAEQGALFENVGDWKRPWYYPRAGDSMRAALDREVQAVRQGVGILDASTLGKIDVRGPDAGELLNRVYTNGWKNLPVGRAKYGLMLGEDGMVMDDGVSARIAEDRYHMTTTTGGAARVLAWLEEWLQTEWRDLRVFLTSTTDQWAAISLAGPRSREVAARVLEDVDLSAEAFPLMTWREATAAGVPARVFRVSFSGELGYEINVAADYGQRVWDALWAAGQEFGITPYGTESMHILRAEKGFIIPGQETDGSVNPMDLGMHALLSDKKDYLGKRSLQRADAVRADREQFVGLIPVDDAGAPLSEPIPEGAQLTEDPNANEAAKPVPLAGYVTSSYHSPTLGHAISLGMLRRGRERHDEIVYAPQADGRVLRCQVTRPVFYDAEGARQHV
ncbi:MAG: sarcosine oxidase subunit alpha family protein [Halofilum sp. (in: g-proteobacteria)]